MKIEEAIDTKRFVLTTLDEKFVGEDYKSWLLDPEVNRFLETRFISQSDDDLISYVNLMMNSSHSYLFAVISKDSAKHIGNIKLGPINFSHSSAPIGLVIGAREWWGQGVAKEIIAALCLWGFNSLGLAKINAGSYASNEASIRAFLSCGFKIEGRQISQVEVSSGVRDDVILLGKVNPSFVTKDE